MFTGIIEEIGKVTRLRKDTSLPGETRQNHGNLHVEIEATFLPELKIDQSIAHNGVCLTVVSIQENSYTVTVIEESRKKSNFAEVKVGDRINLERAMRMNARLDGHIVQGHVDQIGICEKIEEKNGSHVFTFSYDKNLKNITIEKGSITVNGVSLTVVGSETNSFSVAIVPYTYENTNFRFLKKGDSVNLEFDMIGKYVKRLLEAEK